jgi:hypothetical protein
MAQKYPCRSVKSRKQLRIKEALADRTGERNHEAELYRLEGELRLRRMEAAAAAEPWFWRALDIARRQGARSLELRAATRLARALAIQGRRDDGRNTADLTDARALL